jgi:hypothetical protein
MRESGIPKREYRRRGRPLWRREYGPAIQHAAKHTDLKCVLRVDRPAGMDGDRPYQIASSTGADSRSSSRISLDEHALTRMKAVETPRKRHENGFSSPFRLCFSWVYTTAPFS